MSDDEWTMRDATSFDWQTADFDQLETTAEKYGCYVWKTLHRAHESGLDYLIILAYEPHNEYFESIPLGWYQTAETAVEDAINLLEAYKMNLHENHKLFPNIRGVMLKDRALKLTLSRRVQITEMQNGDARVELSFTDHPKTAVINRNQAQNIINMYGAETDDWQGHEIVLYGEEGKWFGKHQWGIRVWDATSSEQPPATVRAAMKAKPAPATNGRKPAPARPAVAYRYDVGTAVVVPGADDEKAGEIVELAVDGSNRPLYVVRVDGKDYRLSDSKFTAVGSANMSLDDINSDLLPEQ